MSIQLDLSKKKKSGKKNLPVSELRKHSVNVRLNDVELSFLNENCKKLNMQKAEFLRCAAIGKLPNSVPEINRNAWTDLSKLIGNLNQYQRKINEGKAAKYPNGMLTDVKKSVDELRYYLLSVSISADILEELD